MKNQIITYLEGPRNFNEGVNLYEQYGFNRMLKAQFRRVGETNETKGTLFEELRKLAGLSEAEFKSLRRKAHNPKRQEAVIAAPVKSPFELRILEIAESFNVSVEELVSDEFREKVLTADENQERMEELEAELDEAQSKYKAAPETVQKTMKFREQFPFLNKPDCPNELKILVADMFTAYDEYRRAHAELVAAPDDQCNEELFRVSQTAVENYLINREIWEELEYYKKHDSILGKAAIFQDLMKKNKLKEIPSIELTRKLTNAKSNISKAKNELKEADTDEKKAKAQAKLDKWSKTRDLIQAEIDNRKNG